VAVRVPVGEVAVTCSCATDPNDQPEATSPSSVIPAGGVYTRPPPLAVAPHEQISIELSRLGCTDGATCRGVVAPAPPHTTVGTGTARSTPENACTNSVHDALPVSGKVQFAPSARSTMRYQTLPLDTPDCAPSAPACSQPAGACMSLGSPVAKCTATRTSPTCAPTGFATVTVGVSSACTEAAERNWIAIRYRPGFPCAGTAPAGRSRRFRRCTR